MKPFSLEEYLANPSREVITRGGSPVKIHCTNYQGEKPIVAEIEGSGQSLSYNKDGSYFSDGESVRDLFFASKKHEDWLNIFSSGVAFHIDDHLYASKERAEKEGKGREGYVATGKFEWEE